MLTACGVSSNQDPWTKDATSIEEVSGVVVRDGYIYLVDDSNRNMVFRARMPAEPGSIIDLTTLPLERREFGIGILTDLESVEFLADGRLVILSERLRALASEDGIVIEYDYPLAEIGRRGLEGLAVRKLESRGSRLATLWEGGYPDHGSLHPDVEGILGERPLSPLVFVNDIAPGAHPGRIRWEEGLHHVVLDVPKPLGDEPEAQRFRAPGIEWCWLPERGPDAWGFVTILSSQDATARPEYRNHWLLRFDLDGKPVGKPLNLEDVVPATSAHANWEGLAWVEVGRSLILVHEGRGEASPTPLSLNSRPSGVMTPGSRHIYSQQAAITEEIGHSAKRHPSPGESRGTPVPAPEPRRRIRRKALSIS